MADMTTGNDHDEHEPLDEGEAGSETAPGPSTLPTSEHASLKYSLLGPSLTKAGQDSVDQSKVG